MLRAGALGDFVLTLPALSALRHQFPRAQIDLIASRSAGSLAATSGYVDRLIALDERWVASLFGDVLADDARAALVGADLAVIWLANYAHVMANVRRSGVPLVHAASSFPPDGTPVHVADHLLATLTPLGVSFEAAAPRIRLRESDRDRGARALASAGVEPRQPLAVLHPGSGSQFKNWPAERFVALAENLADRFDGVVVLAGPADEGTIGQVMAASASLDRHGRIRALAPTDTVELAAVISHATVYVGNDSGATHVAAAIGASTVAIFGPTDPGRWAPRGPRVRLVRNPVECSPCSRPVMQACSHRNCLTQLALAPVLGAIDELLTASRSTVVI